MGTAQVILYGLLVVLIGVGTFLGLNGASAQQDNAVRNEMVSTLSSIAGRAQAWQATPTELRGEGITGRSVGYKDFTFHVYDPTIGSGETEVTIGNAKYVINSADSA